MRKTVSVELVVLALTLTVVACGGSPSGPSNTPDFTGVWQGNWLRASCTETGGAQGVACAQTPTSGALRLTLSQSGNELQGNVEVGSFVIPASGVVNSSGSLSLSGSARQGSATGTLSNWSTSRSGNTMTGTFTLTIVADNPAFGSQILGLTLQGVARSS